LVRDIPFTVSLTDTHICLAGKDRAPASQAPVNRPERSSRDRARSTLVALNGWPGVSPASRRAVASQMNAIRFVGLSVSFSRPRNAGRRVPFVTVFLPGTALSLKASWSEEVRPTGSQVPS
jgi:hypothetical protein